MSLGVTDPAAVEDALRKSARVVDSSDAGKKLYGAGILQAADAVARVTFRHALVRLLALLAVTLLVARAARKKNARAASPWRPPTGSPRSPPGRASSSSRPGSCRACTLAVDVLARPIADMDLLAGVGGTPLPPARQRAHPVRPHGRSPSAMKRLRPVIAGFSAGTAAYLASVVVLGDAAGPFGHAPLLLWCGANALLCVWIARTNLAETT